MVKNSWIIFVYGKTSTYSCWPNQTSLKANISRLLNPFKGMEFHYIDQNCFIITSEHKVDYQNALKGNPRWLLEKHGMLLAPSDPSPDQQDY